MDVFMGRSKNFTDIKLILIISLRCKYKTRYYFQLEIDGQCLCSSHMAHVEAVECHVICHFKVCI